MSEREADYRIEDDARRQCPHDGPVWVVRICANCGAMLEPTEETPGVAYATQGSASNTTGDERSA